MNINRASSQNNLKTDTSILNQLNLARIYNITKDLSSFRTRLTGTLDCSLAANYIQSILKNKLNVTDVHEEFWTYNGTLSSNVVARINGTNLKNELIIISAHYDSISDSDTAPGANDNAVSVAVCMEVMRLIQNYGVMNRTLLFLAFAGEEQAFIGSKAWLNEHKAEVSKIIGVINLDMIGFGDKFSLVENEQSTWLSDAIIEASSSVNTTFIKSISPYPENARFDHDTFWLKQISAVSIFENGPIYSYYHTSADTIDKISFPLVQTCASVLVLSLLYLGASEFQHNGFLSSIIIYFSIGLASIFPLVVFIKINKSLIIHTE